MTHDQVSSENAEIKVETVNNIRSMVAASRSGASNVVAMPGVAVAGQGATPAIIIDSRVPDNATVPLPVTNERDNFPVDKLPPLFRDSILELHVKEQVPVGVIGMVALTTSAFVCQQHANIENLRGGDDVLSMYSMTLGKSGDGKGVTFKAYMRAINEWANERLAQCERLQTGWEGRDVEAQRKLATLSGFESAAARREAEDRIIADLGPRPWLPKGTMTEATPEGMIQFLRFDRPSAMLATEEASAFFGSYAMNKDNRDKMRGQLVELWGGDTISGRTVKRGRTGASGYRFSLMLAGQPEIMEATLRNSADMDQGFFARMLLAAPPSMQGYRKRPRGRMPTPHTDALSNRLLEIYAQSPHTDQSGFSIQPTKIGWTDDALEAAYDATDAIEGRLKPGGDLRPLAPIANRMVQVASRLAGLFAFMETARPYTIQIGDQPGLGVQDGMHSGPITAEHFAAGMAIVEYSVDQWRNVIEGGAGSAKVEDATKIINQLRRVRDNAASSGGQPALRMGQFSWSALGKAGAFKGLSGSSDGNAQEYVKAEVLPYLVEKGHLMFRRDARNKPIWVIADPD